MENTEKAIERWMVRNFVLVLACLAAFAVSFVAVAANMPTDPAPSSARQGRTVRTHDTTLPEVGDLDLTPRLAPDAILTVPTVVIVAPKRAVKVAPKVAPLAWGCRSAEGLLSDATGQYRQCGYYPAPH